MPEELDSMYQSIIQDIIRDHPTWSQDRIKQEFYLLLARSSPAFLDDSHVLLPGQESNEEER